MVPDESAVIGEFTDRWDRGESPRIEDFLSRIPAGSRQAAVELIYRQFCLEEADGGAPSSDAYLERFSEYRDALGRLFRLHGETTDSQIRRWARIVDSDAWDDPFAIEPELPTEGDRIGPFLLRRVLGEGAFARVFLAEQTDLDDRQVVVKVSSRPSREPWLLARVRHPHIVEIIAQHEVDDGALQLICMPYLGGAPLSRVLEALRRRKTRPTTGRAFLLGLDAAAIVEYPESRRSRTSRDLVAASTLDQAVAWIVARLAEALDFAATRKVVHGDIKPSNVLIAADAAPMLLDFNLAQDWNSDDPESGPIDRGGTFAYMAPERLRSLAAADRSTEPIDPHPADLYSLGVLLLEMLSGRAPSIVDDSAPSPKTRRKAAEEFRASAARLADARSRTTPKELIERSSDRRIPAGLRAILSRCLDPEPAQRYGRGRELAVDLDRWRTDRSLVYAREPVLPALRRRIRRSRRPIAAAAAVVLTAAAVGGGVHRVVNSRNLETWKKMGLEKLASLWDAPETRIFGFLRMMIGGDRQELSYLPAASTAEPTPSHLVGLRPDVQSKSMEVATLALRDYRLLELDDWRLRDDVRALPEVDRDELALWLMEQAYRYCHELASRPDSPDDWERALAALDHLSATVPLSAFVRLRVGLDHALERLQAQGVPTASATGDRKSVGGGSADQPAAAAGSAPSWLDEYILGVAFECEAAQPVLTDGGLAPNSGFGSIDEQILGCYRAVLAQRPDSFWANYRAAVVSRRLGLARDSSAHLAVCVRQRPENPAVRGQLAGSLLLQNRLSEALSECDQAIALDPDHAEYHRTRAFIDADLGRSEDIRGDLHRFEVLSRVIPASQLGPRPQPGRTTAPSDSEALRLAIDPRSGDATGPSGAVQRIGRRAPIDPEDLDTRFNLAVVVYQKAHDSEQAIDELTKLLSIAPDHLHARIFRAKLFVIAGSFDEAERDLDRIRIDSSLTEFLREKPDAVGRIIDVSWEYMRRNRNREGLDLARTALEYAAALETHVGLAHYAVARASARLAAADPALVEQVAEHLARAFEKQWERGGFSEWYKQDLSFSPIRARIDEALKREAARSPQRPAVQAAFQRATRSTE